MADCYKIKLRSAGYRLVYQVVDNRLVITVVVLVSVNALRPIQLLRKG